LIFNDNLMFIHVPKTGGMAITEALLETLDPPVYYSVPKGAPAWRKTKPHITLIEGKRHEFLDEAAEVALGLGRRLEDFHSVIAAIRNPYEMEVSRYFYLRLGHPWDEGVGQQLALESDFATFAIESPFHGRPSARIDRFLTIEGVVPSNMIILRFEQLEADFRKALKTTGIADPPRLRTVNATKHADYREYLTARAEQAIYERFRWVFDQGFYPREPLVHG
jgi:hypothetical protein